MRRFFAVPLVSLFLLTALPAAADPPLREVEYRVTAVRDGLVSHAVVRVDFVGGSAQDQVVVDVDEIDGIGERPAPAIAIDRSGSLRSEAALALSAEEDLICSFMGLESENMTGVGRGDRWERLTDSPGRHNRTRYTVLDARQGYVQLSVQRESVNGDGAVTRWNGTLVYDATGVVPTRIALNGLFSGDGTWTSGTRNLAMAIELRRDTFQR